MTIDPSLLEILVCPDDHGPLHLVDGALYNPRTHRRYDVVDGIPVMLVSESTVVDDDEHARLQAMIDAESIPPTGGGAADHGGPSN